MFAKCMNFGIKMVMPNSIYSFQNIFKSKDKITGDIYIFFMPEALQQNKKTL